MNVLALEASTSSVKALVYSHQKGILSSASEPYASATKKLGILDVRSVHEALLKVGSRVAANMDISAIALCSSWHTTTVLDRSLEPQTPMYTWEYTGASSLSSEMRRDTVAADMLYRTTGCVPNAVFPRQTLLHLIKEEGLSIKDRLISSQGAYSFYRMTGDFAETVCIQSGGGFVNLKNVSYDPYVLDLLGADESQFGQLITYRDTSLLNKQSAAALGIKAGIPVVASHSDGAYNQIGSSCGRKGRMTLSVGTSGAMRLTIRDPLFAKNQETWCYYGVDGFIAGAAVSGACNCIDWYKQGLLKNRSSFAQLEMASTYLKGDPPVFLPFMYGERCPGWRDDRRAGFVDIIPTHDEADFYLAIQLGVIYSLLQCYHPLTSLAGAPDAIVVSGGILNSPRWCQILADAFSKPIMCVENPNASAIGAAVVALHAIGCISNLNDFSAEFDKASTVSPIQENLSWHEKQYRRYLDWYHTA